MNIENIKEQEREKIAELLKSAKDEYVKYIYNFEGTCFDGSLSDENNFSAFFLQSKGLAFKPIAEYEDVGADVYRCSNCHHAPTATYDDEWAFTPHCGTCGAEMRNAEELRKKQKEKVEEITGKNKKNKRKK